MTVNVHTPVTNTELPISIFLAGSIDNGAAEEWQQRLIKNLSFTKYNFEVSNPRRDNWDQKISNEDMQKQILWELNRLEKSDIIAMYFAEDSYSPISLLELGIHKNSNIVVYCPKEFYRFQNVDVTCKYYNIPIFTCKILWFDAILQKCQDMESYS
jgi:hypothetical protein